MILQLRENSLDSCSRVARAKLQYVFRLILVRWSLKQDATGEKLRACLIKFAITSLLKTHSGNFVIKANFVKHLSGLHP